MNDLITKLLESGLGYIWFILLAIWGGTVNYIGRIKQGSVKSFSCTELVGEWAVSGFSGLLTAFICIELGMSWHMTAFFTGITGHLGGRAIYMLENYAKKQFPIIDEAVKRKCKDKGNDNV